MSQGFVNGQSFSVPLPVESGGTELISLTPYTLLAGGTSSTSPMQQVSAGTASQILQSNGASALPTFTATPSLTSVRLSNTGILDNNGNTIVSLDATTTAVNYFNLKNQAASSAPILSVLGSDSNISMIIQGKGTSGLQLKGASNGTATASGYVGEIISSVIASGSAINITNATSTNLTSISLTAGNWMVSGNITFLGSGSNIAQANAWCSTTSATLPDISLRAGIGSALALWIASIQTATLFLQLSATTTVYITGNVGLPSGTCTQCGQIQAIRLP